MNTYSIHCVIVNTYSTLCVEVNKYSNLCIIVNRYSSLCYSEYILKSLCYSEYILKSLCYSEYILKSLCYSKCVLNSSLCVIVNAYWIEVFVLCSATHTVWKPYLFYLTMLWISFWISKSWLYIWALQKIKGNFLPS